jgi:hypothetical protein
MIKQLKIPEEKQKQIVSFFEQEIQSALRSRTELERHWIKQYGMFEGKPSQEVKTFPWPQASNVVINILSITINAFIARQINSLFQYRPFWTVTALNRKWTDHAIPTQRLLEYAQRFEMKLIKNIVNYFYDMALYGTGIAKIPWLLEVKEDKRYNDSGDVIKAMINMADGPRFIPISIYDFIVPIQYAADIQSTPWIAHRFRLRYPQIKERERLGFYANSDKIERAFKVKADQITIEKERIQYLEHSYTAEEYEIYEIWCDYDFDDDGVEEKCVFTINFDASTILRAVLNPFNHRLRPFIATQCFPRPYSIYGLGFGHKLERLQEAITTQANQAIDNATIANTRCITYTAGSGIKPPLKIYPGKAIKVTNPGDIGSFQLGDIYPSTNLIINFLRDVCERETGISDYSLGKESSIVKSGATATSTLALIQEGSRLFDFLLKNLRQDMSDVAYQVYSLYSQFKPSGLVFSLLDKDGSLVEETWNATTEEDIRRCLQFELTASNIYTNQMLERESWVQLLNMIMGYYNRIFEAAQLIVSPQAPKELRDLVGKMVISGTLIMDRIIDRWGILDKERVILQPEDIEALIGQAEAQAPQRAQQQQMMELLREAIKRGGRQQGARQQRPPGVQGTPAVPPTFGPAGVGGPSGPPPAPRL